MADADARVHGTKTNVEKSIEDTRNIISSIDEKRINEISKTNGVPNWIMTDINSKYLGIESRLEKHTGYMQEKLLEYMKKVFSLKLAYHNYLTATRNINSEELKDLSYTNSVSLNMAKRKVKKTYDTLTRQIAIFDFYDNNINIAANLIYSGSYYDVRGIPPFQITSFLAQLTQIGAIDRSK